MMPESSSQRKAGLAVGRLLKRPPLRSLRTWLETPIAQIEQIHGVGDPKFLPLDLRLAHHLQQASSIGREDQIGASAEDIGHFAAAKSSRHLGFGQVVRAGGAAADLRFRKVDKFQSRHLREEPARGIANFLCMPQMAGVVMVLSKCTAPG